MITITTKSFHITCYYLNTCVTTKTTILNVTNVTSNTGSTHVTTETRMDFRLLTVKCKLCTVSCQLFAVDGKMST